MILDLIKKMEKSTKPISINIQHQKDSDSPTSSQFENYIIISNKSLSNECKSLRSELKTKEIKIEELTNENEKFDNSIRYLRGLLKNYVDLEDKAMIINNKYKIIIDKNINTFKNNLLFPVKNKNIVEIVFVVNMIFFLLSIYKNIFVSLCIVIQSSIIYFYCNYNDIFLFNKQNIKSDSLLKEIDKINNEIKDIKSSCDFLSDLIDVV